jgi:hypothetical protein
MDHKVIKRKGKEVRELSKSLKTRTLLTVGSH